VDGLEARLRACQRDLDAGSGALGEAHREALEQRADAARLVLRVQALEAAAAGRWSPWAWMGVGVIGAVTALVVTALVVR
jgi:hypothetical protein